MTHTETPADQLRAAKALIDTPDKWTREVMGRDISGHPVEDVDSAVCFCIIGATVVARAPLDGPLRDSLPEWAHASFADFNDSPRTSHADVMALFDRAIELAESDA